jgi:hypothetical protein
MQDYKFKKSLSLGHFYEKKFIDMTPHTTCVRSDTSNYDVILDGVKYEVKYDSFLERTGNFCIEISSNKKPSGLSITEAEFYIIFDSSDNMTKIQVSVLKKQIEHQKTVMLGYNKLSECVLLPKDLFLPKSKCLFF